MEKNADNDKLNEAVNFLKLKINEAPHVTFVLGSGLSSLADLIESPTTISYGEIPHFIDTNVAGHRGELIIGNLGKVRVAFLCGRIHAYEGHSTSDIVFAVRSLALLGSKTFILTNAAGSVNPDYHPGDIVMIKDHLNLTGINPLVGKNHDNLGPRFVDMTYTYCPNLQKSALKAAENIDYQLQKGVYCAMLGPTYETPAEIQMIKRIGADMVGMSTVIEAIALRHMGVTSILGLSCITNYGAGLSHSELDHGHIKEQADQIMGTFKKLTHSFLENISNGLENDEGLE